MKMIAEYLERALQFEQLAARETDEKLKETLLNQAAAYQKLALKRTNKLDVILPPPKDAR